MKTFEHAILTIQFGESESVGMSHFYSQPEDDVRRAVYSGEDPQKMIDEMFVTLGDKGFQLVAVVRDTANQKTFYFKRHVE